MKTLLSLLTVLTLTGCQSMMYGKATDLDKLSLGMTKDQVIKQFGPPVATHVDGDRHEEYLIYKKMQATMDWDPHLYKITFRDGKLVKWGEQYEETNVNNY